ncbi:MAG: D-proline reductase (dithiol) proprotein PrdA [Deltaproteobacteria bacterium]|jgi:D-proline reductase (dithiol) PrdA|nr:D-proline reductase (dithiol) proprotein PrdA [Deltaproteobacteria bacterium]
MSMTKEHAEQYKDKPAVVCCRATKGTVITAAELEDPGIFPDLEESGLITITPETLTVGEVIGATLTRDVDGLTSLTAAMLDGVTKKAEAAPAPVAAAAPAAAAPVAAACCGGVLHIKADSVTGLDLTIPLGGFGGAVPAEFAAAAVAGEAAPACRMDDEVVSTLEKRFFNVKEVKLGAKTAFEDGVLTLRKGAEKDAMKAYPLIKKMAVDIITPDKRHVHTETIMDVVPVATKVEGDLGAGVTNTLGKVVFVLTGVDEAGTQVHEFGSSDGFMDETIIFGRPGCPDQDDIIVRVHCVLQRLTGMERRGPMAAHGACDHIIQEVRDVIRGLEASKADDVVKTDYVRRHGRPRVLLVKEIMGQGAMHDNIILPMEPAGVLGGRPNVDLGNVPLVLNVNEVRDGGIHALCCIGPASKEMTRHYFREPMVELLANDPEINLVGVAFVGSPQVNDEKTFVSRRLGAMADTMDIAGCIVTTEGFGNNHIDFASHIEQMGSRGIKVVGVSYCAYQGQLVVGNKYTDAMVELNKDAGGFESERLGENTLTAPEAKRALAMLKNKLAGVAIAAPESKWNQAVIDANNKLVG